MFAFLPLLFAIFFNLSLLSAKNLDSHAPKPLPIAKQGNLQDVFLKKDINYYLARNDKILWNYYNQVILQSQKQDYPTYRGRYIIDAKSYLSLSSQAKQDLSGQIVFASVILEDSTKGSKSPKSLNYSEFGGISIRGILAQDVDDRNAKTYFFKLDSRYYSDLEALDKGRRIYLYCILPSFSYCVMLGIHEEWRE